MTSWIFPLEMPIYQSLHCHVPPDMGPLWGYLPFCLFCYHELIYYRQFISGLDKKILWLTILAYLIYFQSKGATFNFTLNIIDNDCFIMVWTRRPPMPPPGAVSGMLVLNHEVAEYTFPQPPNWRCKPNVAEKGSLATHVGWVSPSSAPSSNSSPAGAGHFPPVCHKGHRISSNGSLTSVISPTAGRLT